MFGYRNRIAGLSYSSDFRSNISRMQQHSKIGDLRLSVVWYALVAACVLSNSSAATPVVQEGDCPRSASSKAADQAPMRVIRQSKV